MSIPNTIRVNAPIAVPTESAEFGSHFAKYGVGGFFSVPLVADLDNVPVLRRELGMLVRVNNPVGEPPKYYTWETDGISNFWQEEVFNSNTPSSLQQYNIQEGTSYTVVAGDLDKIILFTSDSAITLDIPELIAGMHFVVEQGGDGIIDWSGSASSINNGSDHTKTRVKYSQAAFSTPNGTTYTVSGDTA